MYLCVCTCMPTSASIFISHSYYSSPFSFRPWGHGLRKVCNKIAPTQSLVRPITLRLKWSRRWRFQPMIRATRTIICRAAVAHVLPIFADSFYRFCWWTCAKGIRTRYQRGLVGAWRFGLRTVGWKGAFWVGISFPEAWRCDGKAECIAWNIGFSK